MAATSTSSRVSSISSGRLTWTDIVDPTQQDVAALASKHDFLALDVEDALSTQLLTKVEVHGDYMFVCLLIPAQDAQGNITSRHLSIFFGKDFLVTLHPSSLDTVLQIFRQCQTDQKAREETMKSSAFLAYYVIDALLDGTFAILDQVQAKLDAIEKVVFNEKKSNSRAINSARRQIALLRRIVYPLQLYLPDLSQAQKFSKEDLTVYFSDNRHKIAKIARILDTMKEMVEIYNDTDYTTSSNRTNNILAFLTIIFTLTLPAAVIAALYGMNVNLPGALSPGPATFLGTYTSLILIVAAIVVLTSIMVVYFKRSGWF